jgi:hypothetical protein
MPTINSCPARWAGVIAAASCSPHEGAFVVGELVVVVVLELLGVVLAVPEVEVPDGAVVDAPEVAALGDVVGATPGSPVEHAVTTPSADTTASAPMARAGRSSRVEVTRPNLSRAAELGETRASPGAAGPRAGRGRP